MEQEKFPITRVLLALLSIPILIAAQVVSSAIGGGLYALSGQETLGNVAAGVLYPIAALAGLWALCRFALKGTLADWRITRPGWKPVWAASAVLLPALVCGVFLLLPGRWMEAAEPVDMASRLAVGILYVGVGTGIVEEAVFRGVLMTALERRWGRIPAILVPSVLFGALHIVGGGMDVLSMVQLVAAGTMVGVLFSLVAIESGNIWNGALIHGVWNCALLCVLHIGPEPDPWSFFNYAPEGTGFLLTGGDFGVEASVVSVAAYALFAALALALLWKKENACQGKGR